MKLYLAQHGEACAKEVDPSRPLSEQGLADINQLATFLKQANIQVGRVIHSGKRRAMQTAECLAKSIAPGTELETSNNINPNDDPKSINWKSECGGSDTLIVGHLPFMAKLVSFLLFNDENQLIIRFHPGSIICLEHYNDAHWQINWMIRPELFRVQ